MNQDFLKTYPEMNEEEKEQMWDYVADYMAMPEEDRVPKTHKELYEALQVPERTFYWHLQDDRFMKLVVRKSLIQAKKYIPNTLRQLQKNVAEGKEKSAELLLKYVGELAEKFDHTSEGKQITGFNYVVPEAPKKPVEESYDANPQTDVQATPSVGETPGQPN